MRMILISMIGFFDTSWQNDRKISLYNKPNFAKITLLTRREPLAN